MTNPGQTTSGELRWERSDRLDPDRAIARIADVEGVQLKIEGPCRGGEVGAFYIRWPDDRPGVLTMGRPESAALVAAARAAGIPAPSYDLAVIDDAVCYLVQSRLIGEIPTRVDHGLVAAMVEMNARFAGLLSNRPDLPSIPLFLRASGPGFCLHEPLRVYDHRTARLLTWVYEVGATRDLADGNDLVHLDFHTANVLVGPESHEITGVVDWDGAGRGDRRLDLVTLRFDVARHAPDELPWLDAVLAEAIPPDRLRAYWAHMSLRQVDWSIRHHTSADVDFWLGVVEPGLAV